jgi:hypothetical protein
VSAVTGKGIDRLVGMLFMLVGDQRHR